MEKQTVRRRHSWPGIVGWTLFVLSVVGALVARARLTWMPAWYLAALIGAGVAAWRLLRWRPSRRRVRWPAIAITVAVLVALSPVPWMRANLVTPPGSAWKLDGWVKVDGQVVDPEGEWYWLTAGRPPIVGELVRGWITGESAAIDLRGGGATSQPNQSEPAAAAVGLRAAGYPVGDGLDMVHAEVGGFMASTPPGKLFRKLAVGRSHGMMVALVTYAHFSGDELAKGRTIAGTGGINADGSVSPIGGLRAKATAARAVGADVLLYPAVQEYLLVGFDAGSMRLIPVSTLDEAIFALRGDDAAGDRSGDDRR